GRGDSGVWPAGRMGGASASLPWKKTTLWGTLSWLSKVISNGRFTGPARQFLLNEMSLAAIERGLGAVGQPAVLGALAAVVTRLGDGQVEGVEVAGEGVTLEQELAHVEGVDDVLGLGGEPDRLAHRQDHHRRLGDGPLDGQVLGRLVGRQGHPLALGGGMALPPEAEHGSPPPG